MNGRRGPVRWLHHLSLRPPPPEEAAGWEIEHHLREATDRLVEEGWEADEARREAERRFGSVRRYRGRLRRAERERSLAMRWSGAWDGALGGLAATGRTLRREPGVAAAIVLTLALGIGANATMYGIVDRLLLRPPDHVVEPDRLRRVVIDRVAWRGSTIGFPEYLDLTGHGGLAGAAAYGFRRELTRGGGADATRVRAVPTTASFFSLLGVRPALGRFYGPEEDRAGAEATAVISHEYWQRAFGADPGVLGRAIELRGEPFTVIGVLPAGFTGVGLEPVDLWLPIETTESLFAGGDSWPFRRETRGSFWMESVVRLAEGVPLASAEAEATRLHRNGYREEIEQGRYDARASVALEPLIRARGSEAPAVAKVAGWLLGVSLLVLVIACTNVANLLLARGARRQRDVAVRLALGISRRRLVGEAVMESTLLALAGGGAALVLGRGGGEVVRRLLLPGVLFPRGAVDGRVLLYVVAVAVLAGVLSGLVPALQGVRTNVSSCPGGGARTFTAGRSRFRGALTVAQAAMCVVLLVGAGLFVRSVREVRGLDLGLDVDRVLMAQIEWGDGASLAERATLYDEARQSIATRPGVEAAAVTSVPFGTGAGGGLRVPGFDSLPRLPGGGPYYYGVGADYFRTLGLRVLEGRGIEATDGSRSQRVAVVSRTMAETLWPGASALGRCLILGRSEECATIVGVVEDATRYGLPDRDLGAYMAYYIPFGQDEDRALQALYVRARGNPRDFVEPVTTHLRGFSPHVRYATVQTLRERIDPQARSWTLGVVLFSVFGLLALLLAAVGLYSVLAFDVAQRTRELGIRSALGAERRRLLAGVVLRGARMAGIGVAIGLAVAWLAGPRIADLLFEVSPREPGVLAGVAALLLAVALAASLAPGVRATRVDPVVALRAE